MSLILSIDTSSELCSVALSNSGELISHSECLDNFSHATQLNALISKVLLEAGVSIKELKAVALSKGPGSYTGLRIGASTAKGICYANSIPLIAISTLKALAHQALGYKEKFPPNCNFLPALDARRSEVYFTIYDSELNELYPVEPLILNSEKDLPSLSYPVIYFGSGAEKCKPFLVEPDFFFLDQVNCSAKNLVKLAEEAYLNREFENISYFQPFYLKEYQAIRSIKNRLVLND